MFKGYTSFVKVWLIGRNTDNKTHLCVSRIYATDVNLKKKSKKYCYYR